MIPAMFMIPMILLQAHIVTPTYDPYDFLKGAYDLCHAYEELIMISLKGPMIP